ncbi:MAG: Stp1/IreP family PP2C-type Ser/Thr phosphatase [Limnochordia bacterium]|jgi:serine/threonine protein phosphatase PrpC
MEIGYRSEIGLVRKANEDSYYLHDHLFAVADGMGGHRAGEVASRLALETIARHPISSADPYESLRQACLAANEAILSQGSQDPQLAGMGTTLTALWLLPKAAWIAHIGDSRAYLYRGELSQLTTDHSLVGELLRSGSLSGEEARRHPQRNLLTKALGTTGETEVDIFQVEVQKGDRILLCTDGLTGVVEDQELAHYLAQRKEPQGIVDILIDLVYRRGAPDNVTAILLQMGD